MHVDALMQLIPLIALLRPDDCAVHVAPPFAVAMICPESPAAKHAIGVGHETAKSAALVPGKGFCHVHEPPADSASGLGLSARGDAPRSTVRCSAWSSVCP